MTFVCKTVKRDDVDHQKYVDLEQRYMEEIPNELLKKHNYLYSSVGNSYYKKAFSICVGDATVISDDVRKIDLLLMHLKYMFKKIDTEVIFDQPYHFKGYNIKFEGLQLSYY